MFGWGVQLEAGVRELVVELRVVKRSKGLLTLGVTGISK